MKYIVTILSLVISGCVPLVAGGLGAALVTGAGIYCATTTQAAKEAIRASTTGGKQVLACTEE